jgi:hypothetical protein
MPMKNFFMSRTIWVLLAMLCVGLFGIFVPQRPEVDINPQSLRYLCGGLLVLLFGMGVSYRSKARSHLHVGGSDLHMGGMICAPIALVLALSISGCNLTTDTGQQVTPVQQAQVLMGALNDTYIPARKVYEQVYANSSAETQKMLNQKVNPLVNKANAALTTMSNLVVMWATAGGAAPAGYEDAVKVAQEAVPLAVKAMVDASTKPTTAQ